MQLSSLHRIAIVAPFYLASLVILFIPMTPGVATFSLFDTFVHIGLFFVLGAVTFFTYPQSIRFAVWGLVIYGAYSGILQSLTATRTSDIGDLFNDCIGIGIALLLFSFFSHVTSSPSPIKTRVSRAKIIRKRKQSTKKIILRSLPNNT